MDSYFWFNIFKDIDHNTLIVLFLITFTIYLISTYCKYKLELEDKSDSKDDKK
jgi:hypothetical protein